MKDNATGSVKVTYYSRCMGDGPPVKTNKCSGLRVGSRVQFTGKISQAWMLECIEMIIDKIFKTIYLHIFIYFRFIYFSQNRSCKMPKRPSGMEANF